MITCEKIRLIFNRKVKNRCKNNKFCGHEAPVLDNAYVKEIIHYPLSSMFTSACFKVFNVLSIIMTTYQPGPCYCIMCSYKRSLQELPRSTCDYLYVSLLWNLLSGTQKLYNIFQFSPELFCFFSTRIIFISVALVLL